MANTTYRTSRSVIASATPEERAAAMQDLGLLFSHLPNMGVALVAITVRQGRVEITLSDPIPPEQEAHLGVILG